MNTTGEIQKKKKSLKKNYSTTTN